MAAECLCFRARRVSRAVTRIYDEELRPLGLQATQLTLLNAVAIGGERGAAMKRLADVLAMDPTTLSRNLRPLERDGLLCIERANGDRRVRLARLTDEGRRRLEAAYPLWQRAHDRLTRALGGDDAHALRQQLDAAVAATLPGGSVDPPPPRSSR